MRQTVGPLNRTWLFIIGLVVLLLGTAGILFASDLANRVAQAVGLNTELARPSASAVPADMLSIFDSRLAAIIVAIAGIVFAVLALMWLIAQIPRKDETRPLRLYEDGADGLTTCDPGVVAEAVEDQIETFPGVLRAKAVLRGTACAPELTVNVTVGDRADMPELVASIYEQAAADLETALEAPLQRIGLLLDVASGNRAEKSVVL